MADAQLAMARRITYLKQVWADTKAKQPPYTGKISTVQISNSTPENIPVGNPMVRITAADAFSHAQQFVLGAKERNVKVKIMCITSGCSTNKGSGLKDGIEHPEATLCRRSNYYKALKELTGIEYPLSVGTLIYAKDVTIFKNESFEQYDPKYYFNVDVLSAILPNRPSVISMNNTDMYEKESDRKMTVLCINKIIALASKLKYDMLIFNELCLAERHPSDCVKKILADELKFAPIRAIFYTMQKGEPTGELKIERKRYLQYREALDNRDNRESFSDCEDTKKEDSPVQEIRRRRRKPLKMVIEDDDEIKRGAEIDESRYTAVDQSSNESEASSSDSSDSSDSD